jgi:Ca2+-binding EF-hand superfamily protein
MPHAENKVLDDIGLDEVIREVDAGNKGSLTLDEFLALVEFVNEIYITASQEQELLEEMSLLSDDDGDDGLDRLFAERSLR